MRWFVMPVVLIVAAASLAGDWPQWLGPNRNGSTTETIKPWTGAPKVLWKAPVGDGHSSPVVANGKVFLHTRPPGKDEEQLSIFDAATGKDLGTSVQPRKPFSSIFGVGPRATPLVTADGQVVTLGVTGNLNVQTPARNWIVDILETNSAPNLRFGVSASPLQVDDKLVVMPGGKGAGLVAYNRADGKVAWKSLDDPASYASPILIEQAGQKLIVALTASGVVAVQPSDGALVWRFPFKDAMSESSTTPVVVGDKLIVSSITLGTTALKLIAKDGKPAIEQLWDKPLLTCYFSTPVAVGDDIYLATGRMLPPASMTLHCVEAATGNVRWSQKNVGKYHTALLRTGDQKLLMHGDDGNLALIEPNPKEYRELRKAKICGETWAHPAIANGRVYVRDAKNLICVQVGE